MEMSAKTKKVLALAKVGAATLLASVLLASVVYVCADEALSRMQRASLRSQCLSFLQERAKMAMGENLPPEVEAQIILQCRQAIP